MAQAKSSERRIGVLVPDSNIVHEFEFAKLRPEGVRFAFRPFGFPAADAADYCADLAALMADSAKELKAWGAEVILIGCTTASMKCGQPEHIARMEQMAGVPVVTAASAVREAMKALGLTSLTIATPYGDRSNGIVSNFINSCGVNVSAIAGFAYDVNMTMFKEKATTLTPSEVIKFISDIDQPAADGMFLPCTGVRSVETLAQLEKDRGKAAISSVSAGFWAALRRIGLDGRQEGYGRLLSTWDFAKA
jgi:maleate cis-trans isomerase